MRHLRHGLVTAALLLSAAACDRGEPGRVEPVTGAPEVEVSRAVAAPVPYQTSGRVVSTESAELATRVSGTVDAVLVQVGAAVRPGQVLVRLDDSDVESAYAAARARETAARRYYERIRALEADGAATAHELDQAEAALEMAQASLREAEAARDYVLLRAPFAGTVTARLVDPGDLAVPGRPVLVLAGSQAVKVEADLPARLAGRVAAGDEVAVVHPATSRRWKAIVSRTVPVLDVASHRFRLEARFADVASPPLRGTVVRLELPGDRGSPWVPADAIVRRGQLHGVFTLEEGHLALRWVRTGRRRPGAVEVLAGLSAGEAVVRRPAAGFVDGLATGRVTEVDWSPSSTEPPGRAEERISRRSGEEAR